MNSVVTVIADIMLGAVTDGNWLIICFALTPLDTEIKMTIIGMIG